jgi:hypothetical protein
MAAVDGFLRRSPELTSSQPGPSPRRDITVRTSQVDVYGKPEYLNEKLRT